MHPKNERAREVFYIKFEIFSDAYQTVELPQVNPDSLLQKALTPPIASSCERYFDAEPLQWVQAHAADRNDSKGKTCISCPSFSQSTAATCITDHWGASGGKFTWSTGISQRGGRDTISAKGYRRWSFSSRHQNPSVRAAAQRTFAAAILLTFCCDRTTCRC